MSKRTLVLVAAAAVLAGCGSATSERAGSSIVPDAAAPPVVAVDEAPPADVTALLHAMFAPRPISGSGPNGTIQLCMVSDMAPATSSASCPQPSPEEVAQARAEEERYRAAIEPAATSEPRVVAKLTLHGGDVLFTAWRTSAGAVCWETDAGGGGSGPAGPCTTEDGGACGALCLASAGGDGDDYVLSGTVPLDAEALRVTLAGGATATYPLVGPALLDTNRRVFMLDLGTHDWRKLELVRQGAVAQTLELPRTQAAFEDCSAKLGPPPAPPPSGDTQALLDAMRPYNTALQACVRSSGAISGVDIAHP